MVKNYFVLLELDNYDFYPTLIRIKDFCKNIDICNDDDTTHQLAEKLENMGYKKIESEKNVILISPYVS